MPADNKIILDLKKINKSYGETKVLENINISIYNIEFFTILGSSGSGKSTIIRMIGGFTKPSSGEIIFENKIINDEPIFKRPFNTVFQDYALFPNMNVFNNVGFGLKIKKEIAIIWIEVLLFAIYVTLIGFFPVFWTKNWRITF